jgi:hypothetical protein
MQKHVPFECVKMHTWCVSVCLCGCICIHACMGTHTCMYKHKCIHTHVRMHTHGQKNHCRLRPSVLLCVTCTRTHTLLHSHTHTFRFHPHTHTTHTHTFRFVSVNLRIRDQTTAYLCIEAHVCELLLSLTRFGEIQVSYPCVLCMCC